MTSFPRMAPRRIDSEIDRLYQLPPGEFTAARNALAKQAGAAAADVRSLAKPPIAAWAVNQIYWKQRAVYDALIAASAELRKLHTAVLAGRRADIREAAKAHDESIDAALKAALAILRDEGDPVTDATRQAILITLRALPADDPPGRLTRTLQPGGFEMLSGLSIAGPKSGSAGPGKGRAKAITAPKGSTPAKSPPQAKVTAQENAAREAAARRVREAEQAASRAEFEAARLTREAVKADRQLEQAREALEAAQQTLEDAKTAAATTARARDTAERRAKEAERALDAARRAVKGGGRS